MKNQKAVIQSFTGYQETVPAILDRIEAWKAFKRRRTIWIKPNLVNTSPFPVTSDPEMIRVLAQYIRRHSKARVLIAEGCGDTQMETGEVFERLGYVELARELDLELVDLNQEALRKLSNPSCEVFPQIYLPRSIFSGMLISACVLKRHSLAGVTLSMKNLLGLAPPGHYQQGGSWKKSFFHQKMQRSIFELNLYRKPDLCLIDARVGLAQFHLGGAECCPPVKKMVAGFDPVAVDAAGAGLLGLSWKEVGHIRMADGVLGQAQIN